MPVGVAARGGKGRVFEAGYAAGAKPGCAGWVSRRETPRGRFYRFSYLNKASYWGRTDIWEGIRPNGSTGLGARIRLAERLPEIQERLKGVRLHSWDWTPIPHIADVLWRELIPDLIGTGRHPEKAANLLL
ncbi:MAG: hypothetical protein HZB91_14395 [Elusimicrobia bacterium]|nr:hypothetical protein [Elusimicrobiota bacterium]